MPRQMQPVDLMSASALMPTFEFTSAESLSTLKFANRAKNIRNSASVNEDVDQRTLLRKYERELKRLRGELQQRQAQVVDKRHLLAVRSLANPASFSRAGLW